MLFMFYCYYIIIFIWVLHIVSNDELTGSPTVYQCGSRYLHACVLRAAGLAPQGVDGEDTQVPGHSLERFCAAPWRLYRQTWRHRPFQVSVHIIHGIFIIHRVLSSSMCIWIHCIAYNFSKSTRFRRNMCGLAGVEHRAISTNNMKVFASRQWYQRILTTAIGVLKEVLVSNPKSAKSVHAIFLSFIWIV